MITKYDTGKKVILIIIMLIGIIAFGFWSGELNIERITTDEIDKDVMPTDGLSFDEVEMNVSAYCPCSKCCENFADGITASGTPATGKLIAAPRNYAFGTRMDVPGYGTALVEDRGGAIKGNKIDLLFSTHQEALVFGRQYLTVKVYE